jgi:predicted MPP superfamily phosphohydrolase
MIAESFYIVGREDDKCKTRKELPEIMQGVDKRYPVIVMNHEPHHLQEEADAGADIALYGHTHSGQFFPVNLVLKMSSIIYNMGLLPENMRIWSMYELPYGYKKKEHMHVYVSSGLGLAGPQYRVGTLSEIVVLNVNFK